MHDDSMSCLEDDKSELIMEENVQLGCVSLHRKCPVSVMQPLGHD